jgi:uncharacterized protein (TIGR02611 family)
MTGWRGAWHEFWHTPPGRRFAGRYERLSHSPRGPVGRVLRIIAGVVVVAVGIVFMPLPGPGFVPVLIGFALLAGESQRFAGTLDRGELRVREWLRRRRR